MGWWDCHLRGDRIAIAMEKGFFLWGLPGGDCFVTSFSDFCIFSGRCNFEQKFSQLSTLISENYRRKNSPKLLPFTQTIYK
jgi:hypothetical protein